MDFGYSPEKVEIVVSMPLTAYLADPSNELTLEVWHNCATPTVISIDEDYIDESEIHLLPEHLGMIDVFANGVYRLRLKYLDSTVIEDNGLFYIGEGVDCRLIDLFAQYIECLEEKPCAENYMFWAYGFHDILQSLIWCEETTYENACVVYDKLVSIIGEDFNCDCSE
jgi:hypothetical protein